MIIFRNISREKCPSRDEQLLCPGRVGASGHGEEGLGGWCWGGLELVLTQGEGTGEIIHISPLHFL